MTSLHRTGALVRLALRRDRWRVAIWVAGIVGVVVLSAAGLPGVYPDQAAIDAYVEVSRNPAVTAFAGPGYGFGDPSIGTVLVNEVELSGSVGMALMSLFLVVRHTRAEEDSERVELLRSSTVGRHAPIAAAAAVVSAVNVAVGLSIALGFLAVGYGAVGSLTLAGSLTAVGLVFVGIGAVAAQVASNARGALAIGGLALAAAFMLRAVGDVGDNAWRWASPIGWAQASRAFAGERWWPLAACLVAAVALVVLAFWLSTRRDLGAGIVPARPGPAVASPWMTSPLGLAVKLQWPALLAWSVGLLVMGALFGAIAEDVETIVEDSPAMQDVLVGAGAADIVESYLATAMTMLGSTAAGFAVAASLRLRSEEAAGRAEPVLATATSRWRWGGSHLTVALLGSVLVLVAAGVGVGAARAATTGDAGEVPRLLAAALVTVPAVWVLVGVSVALFGLLPRAALAAWAVLACVWIVGFFGDLLDLPAWARKASPFDHLPLAPLQNVRPTPLLALTAVAAILCAAGLWGFRRRDLGGA